MRERACFCCLVWGSIECIPLCVYLRATRSAVATRPDAAAATAVHDRLDFIFLLCACVVCVVGEFYFYPQLVFFLELIPPIYLFRCGGEVARGMRDGSYAMWEKLPREKRDVNKTRTTMWRVHGVREYMGNVRGDGGMAGRTLDSFLSRKGAA